MFKHIPFSITPGRYPNNIHWDRFNYGLKEHFYTHQNIQSIIGSPEKKYALLYESEAIVPFDYASFLIRDELARDFDLVFSHSERILNKYDNARFIPGSGLWYGTRFGGSVLDPNRYEKKSRNISIVSSDKQMCKLHTIRLNLALKLKKTSGANIDIYGTFDGGENIKIAESLDEYRYSIVIENNITPFYFTEKILNCFASMTVPIYLGAEKIATFFNSDGIIEIGIKDIDSIDHILGQCNEKDYLSRISAIVDNYNRVKDYMCIEDYICNKYASDLGWVWNKL